MVYIFPKKEEMQKVLMRLTKNNSIPIDSKLARDFCKYDAVRILREKDKMYIGSDPRKNKSIIYMKPSIKIEQRGKRFFIKGL